MRHARAASRVLRIRTALGLVVLALHIGLESLFVLPGHLMLRTDVKDAS